MQFDLGEVGIAFVKEQLANGPIFSRALCRRLSGSTSVRASANLPSGLEQSRAFRFNEGGILETETMGKESVSYLSASFTEAQIVNSVSEFIGQRPNRIAVLWNYFHQIKDPAVIKSRSKWFSHEDNVHYFIDSDNLSGILATVRQSMSVPYFLVALVDLCHVEKPSDRSTLNVEQVEDMAKRCVALLSLAYDGDGLISLTL